MDTPERKALALAVFWSPAAMGERGIKGRSMPTGCPLCHGSRGVHEHIFWECAKRPEKIDRPSDEVQARLGWPSGQSRKEDEQVVAYMQGVVSEVVWDQGYGKKKGKGKGHSKGREEEVRSVKRKLPFTSTYSLEEKNGGKKEEEKEGRRKRKAKEDQRRDEDSRRTRQGRDRTRKRMTRTKKRPAASPQEEQGAKRRGVRRREVTGR